MMELQKNLVGFKEPKAGKIKAITYYDEERKRR
jgi:hypothetical protein